MTAAPRLKTYADFMELPEGCRAELIDGQIVQKAQPGGLHARLSASVIGQLVPRFSRKTRSDGTGGWWILSEVTVRYRKTERILQPDIAGWRRDRVPECPKDYPVDVRPDWVCEVSHTTRKKDTTIVPETLAAEGVPHYWLLDVEAENLQVFELVAGGKYALVQSLFRDDGEVVIAPFGPATFKVGVLLGDDPE